MPILSQDEEDWSDEVRRNLIDGLGSVCDDSSCTDETCCFVSVLLDFTLSAGLLEILWMEL